MKEWKKLAEIKEKGLRQVDGILMKQYKDNIHGLKELLVIPKGMRARLISMAHDYCGHVWTDKVTWTLRQNFTHNIIFMHNGKKHKRSHVNLCKKFSTPESQVHRLVVSAADDPYLDEPKLVLAGDAFNTNEREEINKLLDKWNNVLRDTPGHTNILLHLNSITNPDPYYIPLVDELLQKVGSSQVLSKLDLAKGFYQVGLTDEARARSAFVTP